MQIRKKQHSVTREGGFFTLGVAFTLFAIYGAIGAGIVTSNDSAPTKGEELALQTLPTMESEASNSNVN